MHAGVRVVDVVRDRVEVGAQFAAHAQQERAEGERDSGSAGHIDGAASAAGTGVADEEKGDQRSGDHQPEIELEQHRDDDEEPRGGGGTPSPQPKCERGDGERGHHRRTRHVPRRRQRERIDDRARDDGERPDAKCAQRHRQPDGAHREPDHLEREWPTDARDPKGQSVRVEEEGILVVEDVRVEPIAIQ